MGLASDETELEQLYTDQLALNAQVYVDGETVVIKLPDLYVIELSELATPEKLLGKIVALADKSWTSTKLIARLIEIVAGHHGFVLPR